MEKFQRVAINPDNAPRPIGAYSQAMRVKAGSLVFMAGQVALDGNGNLVGKGDVEAQTRQVFENIGQVLKGVGASFSNVVEFTTYLVGKEAIQPYINARTEVLPRLFPDGDYPPNTLLVIEGLVREEFLIEVKTMAALPD